MQSIFHTASNSIPFPLPWNAPETRFTTRKQVSYNQPGHFLIEPFIRTNSLRTSIGYEPENGLDEGPGPSNPDPGLLPVVIRRSGRVSRYLWDGSCLQLVGVDGGASSFSFNFDDGFRTLYRICSLGVRDFFIPKIVGANYIEYVKWKFLHRVFGSALQVIATQAMFRAIGIGYSRSLASAAALNWVLKDGLGRLSRCIYTASLASAFDTNLKRVRFSTSVLFSLSIGVELLTPSYPQYFLLLASVANIGKQISLACYLATGPAVHRSFAIADNIGEVSAKAQIQTMCFDNLGLMLAAILNMLLKNNQGLQAGLPFILYPIFTAVDLFGIYQGLKHVHLQTLTKDRLEIILMTWIELGYVPPPAEVSKEEGINFLCRKDKASWPIRIGYLNPESQISNLSVIAMLSVCKDDYYFICMESFHRGLARATTHGIVMCLREGASTSDIIMGLLQACYIRKAIHSKRNVWEDILKAGEISDAVHWEWLKLIDNSKQLANDDLRSLKEQMPRLGWEVKNVLLSTQEQSRCSFVDD